MCSRVPSCVQSSANLRARLFYRKCATELHRVVSSFSRTVGNSVGSQIVAKEKWARILLLTHCNISGRSERIRTFDPLLPKQVRYQAAPRSEKKPRRGLCWRGNLWGERWDLNPRPPGPQPGALPTELLPPRESSYRQDNFFWQAFFIITVVWILSRKKITLRHPAERGRLRVHIGP